MITRVLVDADDPAFADPTKFIGPVYDEARGARARRRARLDRQARRPKLAPGRRLAGAAARSSSSARSSGWSTAAFSSSASAAAASRWSTVPAARGRRGGDRQGPRLRAAGESGSTPTCWCSPPTSTPSTLGWGTPDRAGDRARHAGASCARESFPAGSMGPKVEAVCRFVEATGHRAAIGRLEDIAALIDGTAGTQVAAR